VRRQLDLIDVRLARVLSVVTFFNPRYVQPQSLVFQALDEHSVHTTSSPTDRLTTNRTIISFMSVSIHLVGHARRSQRILTQMLTYR